MAKNENLRKVIDGIKFRYHLRTQKQICDALGYSSATYLSDLLSGKYPVTEEFSDKLKERFGVNPNFLLLDEGGIWIDGTGNITQMVRTSDEMENIVRAFITLNKAAFTQEFYHFCCEKVGKLFIIKEKRLNGIALTDDELDYLIGVADKHINPENYL